MRDRREPKANRAACSVKSRHFSAELEVEISSAGLVAIGALVSGILLSVVPIVWIAKRDP